jgi:class 3 adenylate cyclase
MYALMEGRFEEAERFIGEYLPLALRVQHPQWIGAMRAQMYDLQRARGRLEELEGTMLETEEEGFGGTHLVWAAIANMYLETGREDEARNWFEKGAAGDFKDFVGEVTELSTLMIYANVAHRLGDKKRAALIYDILAPYEDRQIILPVLILGLGSAARPLAQLALVMERWDDAERLLEKAMVFDERIGARPWLQRTRFLYAELLLQRDEPGDRNRALEFVNQALLECEEMGMPYDVERALALKMELQGVDYADLTTSIEAVSVAVQSQQPDLRTHAAPDGTVTLMFTDIVGSTPLNERLGDQRWMELLKEHNSIIREHVSAHEGYEVKTEGDGFMLAFSSARRAAECAIAIQRAFAVRNETAEEKIEVRAGLHTGEAIQDDGDFYGKHVNLAARIASQATGGQILASSLLKELTDSGGDIDFDGGTELELKGLTGTQRVFTIGW